MARRGEERSVTGRAVESLPVVGTTWQRRGLAYWWRRFLMAFVTFLLLALEVAVIGLVLGSIRHDTGVFTGLLAIVLAVALGTGVYWWRRLGRPDDQRTSRNRSPASASSRRAASGGAATGVLARSGSTLAGTLLFVGAVLFVGFFAALFLRLLAPELYVERQARQRLQARAAGQQAAH
jgi:hypothetical protein